jgi:hypothetical protein
MKKDFAGQNEKKTMPNTSQLERPADILARRKIRKDR